MTALISVPSEVDGLDIIASVSGGKDSTALILALREAEIPARYVFADTRWEASETYDYIDLLRARLSITIDVVGVDGGMPARVRHRAGFPGRKQRWCTRELKIEPLRAYHDTIEAATGVETVSAQGIRAAESSRRAKAVGLEDVPERDATGHRAWGRWMWRPLLAWTIEDVLRIHHRHGVPVNPLYRKGHSRVGCYPCIYASKEEIALLLPTRIAEIRALEAETTALREERNQETPGRYAVSVATFFQTRVPGLTMAIDEVATWARTSHGGRQLSLLAEPPRGGCMRWGICDAPTEEEATP